MSFKAFVVTALLVPCTAASAEVVFGLGNDNGFFTPFDGSNVDDVIYGDSGWMSTGGAAPITLRRMTMGLAVYGGSAMGSTDLVLTLNDGDPSGLVFGTGAELWQTTITNVSLAADPGEDGQFFTLTIDLPDVMTTGGFNNIGWSVRLANYDYDGSFGFQVGTASSQYAGFYTSNASWSWNDGADWGLFSFGGDPNFGVANYTVTFDTVPAPGAFALVGLVALAGRRRR